MQQGVVGAGNRLLLQDVHRRYLDEFVAYQGYDDQPGVDSNLEPDKLELRTQDERVHQVILHDDPPWILYAPAGDGPAGSD